MLSSAITIGILAHVDAGKTTLAERILYLAGAVRKLGRVDHRDAFLDTHELEKERGITIFSKQANLKIDGKKMILLDTPGHVDFSPEMERTLQVLDYAILIISAPDGVTGHVMTLWRLLKRYRVPVFVFVNKMDQPGCDADRVLRELKEKLGEGFVPVPDVSFAATGDVAGGNGRSMSGAGIIPKGSGEEGISNEEDLAGNHTFAWNGEEQNISELCEEMATADEAALEEYLETDALSGETIARLIRERKVFPCFFGSALRGDGTEGFLHALAAWTQYPEMEDSFAARVFKISREKGSRLTWMRIMGGTLKVKDTVKGTQKADQIRIYSGAAFQSAGEVKAGRVCAVAGLSDTYAGEGLGALSSEPVMPTLESVISYGLAFPEGTNIHEAYQLLKQLEEELPELHVSDTSNAAGGGNFHGDRAAGGSGLSGGRADADEDDGQQARPQLTIRVMGQVQIEILRRILKDRFNLDAVFTQARIVYKETIAAPVIGSGHYEPLRHYAEAHLLLEPGEAGSGITFESACPTDDLDLNWQRLIGTHVLEKTHAGVLTGSELTDINVVLLCGRAHLKHTEGGDFREATYRAIRQGLMKAKSVLLEPVYRFRIELPLSLAGRAMADVQKMGGECGGPEVTEDGSSAVLAGAAPVSGMMNYESELREYSHGLGRISLENGGYRPCPDPREIIETIGYDPDADTDNPSGSIFCSHGAGIFIPWNEADGHMHLHPQPARVDADAPRKATGGEKGAGTGSGQDTNYDNKTPSLHPMHETIDSKQDNSRDLRQSLTYDRTAQGKIRAEAENNKSGAEGAKRKSCSAAQSVDDQELMAIFTRTYGEIRTDRGSLRVSRNFNTDTGSRKTGAKDSRKPLLLVDGYNVIHAWPDLKKIADDNLDAARMRLMDILANYRGYRQMTLILVFDAYQVPGGEGEVLDHHGIHVVYTKEAETADAFIEKAVHRLAREFDVTVATSDGMVQMIILGEGARRMPARELIREIDLACEEIRRTYLSGNNAGKRYLFQDVPEELRALLESMRLGEGGPGKPR